MKKDSSALVKNEGWVAGLRCKPDDLAFVTKCEENPQWIGLMVRVLARCLDGRNDWLAEIQGRGVRAPGVNSGHVMRRRRVLLDDWNLTPFTGLDLQDETAHLDQEAFEASA